MGKKAAACGHAPGSDSKQHDTVSRREVCAIAAVDLKALESFCGIELSSHTADAAVAELKGNTQLPAFPLCDQHGRAQFWYVKWSHNPLRWQFVAQQPATATQPPPLFTEKMLSSLLDTVKGPKYAAGISAFRALLAARHGNWYVSIAPTIMREKLSLAVDFVTPTKTVVLDGVTWQSRFLVGLQKLSKQADHGVGFPAYKAGSWTLGEPGIGGYCDIRGNTRFCSIQDGATAAKSCRPGQASGGLPAVGGLGPRPHTATIAKPRAQPSHHKEDDDTGGTHRDTECGDTDNISISMQSLACSVPSASGSVDPHRASSELQIRLGVCHLAVAKRFQSRAEGVCLSLQLTKSGTVNVLMSTTVVGVVANHHTPLAASLLAIPDVRLLCWRCKTQHARLRVEVHGPDSCESTIRQVLSASKKARVPKTLGRLPSAVPPMSNVATPSSSSPCEGTAMPVVSADSPAQDSASCLRDAADDSASVPPPSLLSDQDSRSIQSSRDAASPCTQLTDIPDDLLPDSPPGVASSIRAAISPQSLLHRALRSTDECSRQGPLSAVLDAIDRADLWSHWRNEEATELEEAATELEAAATELEEAAKELGFLAQAKENEPLFAWLRFWQLNGGCSVHAAAKAHFKSLWSGAHLIARLPAIGDDEGSFVHSYQWTPPKRSVPIDCHNVSGAAILSKSSKSGRMGDALSGNCPFVDTDTKTADGSKPLVLYHGTTIEAAAGIVRRINLEPSNRHCDFGEGFYTTPCWQYALGCAYAAFDSDRTSQAPAVLSWTVDTSSKQYTDCKFFEAKQPFEWRTTLMIYRRYLSELTDEQDAVQQKLNKAGCVYGSILGNPREFETRRGKPLPYCLLSKEQPEQFAFRASAVDVLEQGSVVQVYRIMLQRGQWGPVED